MALDIQRVRQKQYNPTPWHHWTIVRHQQLNFAECHKDIMNTNLSNDASASSGNDAITSSSVSMLFIH